MKKGKLICLLSSMIAMTVQPVMAFCQYVGIGTTAPAFKLDVKDGSINTDSVYRIGGSTVLSTKGSGNTFVGFGSGNYNTSGVGNTANGYVALYNNTTGNFNTANGASALSSNTIGSYNTAIGSETLTSNSIGYDNTANGYAALYYNSTGYGNTANGRSALLLNTTGYYNTANGYAALRSNTLGYGNTANGIAALRYNTTGYENTANGYTALDYNITGLYNTAVGAKALNNTPNSSYNTAIGHEAGVGYNLGYNNTLLGAGANVSFSGQYNSIAIGLGATTPDNGTVRLGNTANWSYGGYAGWTNFSDERYKKNVTENVKGLEFIMRLRPVTYYLNVTGLSKKLNEFAGRELDSSMKKAMAEKEEMLWTGFLAQEVELAAKQSGFEFSGVDKPRNDQGLYGLRYAEFVVPLVKAVQEQQQVIEKQQIQINELVKRLESLEKKTN
jgi:trimeric autotransporter adhesin